MTLERAKEGSVDGKVRRMSIVPYNSCQNRLVPSFSVTVAYFGDIFDGPIFVKALKKIFYLVARIDGLTLKLIDAHEEASLTPNNFIFYPFFPA